MNLDEGQRKKVAEWIGQGLKLSEIQTRLASELGVQMTYMDVRFLVDDLRLVPKDIEPLKPVSVHYREQPISNPKPADNLPSLQVRLQSLQTLRVLPRMCRWL